MLENLFFSDQIKWFEHPNIVYQSFVEESHSPNDKESKSVEQPEHAGQDRHQDLHRGHRLCLGHHLGDVGGGEEHEEGHDVRLDLGDLLLERCHDASGRWESRKFEFTKN